MNNETTVTREKGRPVNPNSNRQAKLAERQKRIEAGVGIKRGRPTNGESKRQKRLTDIATRKALGTFKLGRPKVKAIEVDITENVDELVDA